jgi:hypothetical protein
MTPGERSKAAALPANSSTPGKKEILKPICITTMLVTMIRTSEDLHNRMILFKTCTIYNLSIDTHMSGIIH